MIRITLATLLLATTAVAEEEDADDAAPIALPAAMSIPAAVSAPAAATPALTISGYLDVGFANAGGDGTSYHPDENRLPIDYAADPFATAVNSRGDVASNLAPGNKFTNGFTPRSMGIGGRPSPFLSTASLDFRYQLEGSSTMAFLRLQALPRLSSLELNDDRFLLQQAFVRVIPLDSEEFAITIGRFDPVFGIEYLDNEAPIRTGVTPSLIARYTTGWQVGAKAFYRLQFPDLWSAVSLNAAVTTNSPLVEALQPSAVSLNGVPMISGRLGFELNHPSLQLKLGLSGARGARTDQHSEAVGHLQYGGDARLIAGPVVFSAEYNHVDMREGAGDKAGSGTLVSAFIVDGATIFLGLPLKVGLGPLKKATPYLRYDRRWGGFVKFSPIDTDRRTVGARFDVGENAALKLEYLMNVELAGAADVDNDVFTSSLVYSF